MSDSVVGERRRAERRSIPDRRTASDRRLVGERRCGQRRVVDTPVAVERRSGIDRRFRVLSTSSVRDHMVVYALRRLIGRLYQLAKSRHRSEKAEGRLAEARSEILKLDPNLYLVAKTMDELKGSSIAKVKEYGRSTAKKATRKTAAKKRTTKKTVAKTKSSARRTRP